MYLFELRNIVFSSGLVGIFILGMILAVIVAKHEQSVKSKVTLIQLLKGKPNNNLETGAKVCIYLLILMLAVVLVSSLGTEIARAFFPNITSYKF